MQYQRSDNQTDAEVKWYRSRDEQTAGIEIENLTHTPITVLLSGNVSSRTFMQYRLDIKNFSESDRGYYWCQMVVNNAALPPSPHGYINSPKCTLTETTCNVMNQPLCAQKLTLRHMAMSEQNRITCTIEAVTYNEITSTTDSVTSIIYLTESMVNDISSIGISIGILSFIALSMAALIVLLLLTLKFVKGKKHGKYTTTSLFSKHRIIVNTSPCIFGLLYSNNR